MRHTFLYLLASTNPLFSGIDLLAHGSTTTSLSCLVQRCCHSFGGPHSSPVLPLCGKTFFTGQSSQLPSICKRSLWMYKLSFRYFFRFPLGVAAFAMSFTGSLSRMFSPKWIILTGLSMVAVATVLVAVGGGQPQDYWPYIFPAFTLGSAGAMLVYSHTK